MEEFHVESRGHETLKRLASKYIWWKSPEAALKMPQRVVAQVMDLGSFEDVKSMIDAVGEDGLKDAVRLAEAGQFTARSWHYWHYRLGLAKLDEVPELPVRKFTS